MFHWFQIHSYICFCTSFFMFHLICFAYTKLAAHPNEDITGDDAYPPNIRYRERDDINHNGIDELDGENKTLEPVSLPDHHGFNFSLYETEDPGFLVVSAAKPDHAFTIYNTPSKSRTIMPVNLGLVTVAMLKYQIFHAYYRKSDMGVWFEWESTSKEDGELEMDTVMVIASGLEIHATRTLQESDLNFFVEEVKGSNFFRIKSGDKCLNVSDVINESRQSYPLVFKMCDDSLNQEFALVSVMKTVCKLGVESLCGGDEQAQITNAQKIVQKKLSSLFTDRYR